MRSFRIASGMVLALLLTACGGVSDRLVGSWLQVEGARPQSRLILNEDGTGKLEIQGGVNYQLDSWSVESERHIRFQIYQQEVLARFVLNGDSLEISRVESFEMNGTYRRESGG